MAFTIAMGVGTVGIGTMWGSSAGSALIASIHPYNHQHSKHQFEFSHVGNCFGGEREEAKASIF